MDIDLLSRMVKELILDADEVSLPGIGSFVAEMVPSTFSDKGYTINPPYRRLYFRGRQEAGDNSLARLYAASNEVELSDAERIIGDFLAELKEVLQQKKTIVFPELGGSVPRGRTTSSSSPTKTLTSTPPASACRPFP